MTNLLQQACFVLLAILIGAVPSPATQHSEIQVNETTTGDQRRPDVGADDQGNFVVVWSSDDPAPGYDPEIFARRFDRNGLPRGTEFQISSDAHDFERDPKIAVSGNGSFMVVWSGFSDGEFTGILGRRYDGNATAMGGEFVVNSYTSSSQNLPDVLAIDDDEFVAAWSGFGDQDGSAGGIFAQRYDAGGKAGPEFRVNGYTTGSQQEPRLARINNDGDFVVMWEDGDTYSVRVRRFSRLGVGLADEETAIENSQPGEIDGFDGGFVVVWGLSSIYGQRFDDDGNTLGARFTVSDNSLSRHIADPPTVAAQSDGAFLVAWANTETFARRFGTEGEFLGAPFSVNAYTTGFQGKPVPAPLGDDDFVVVWHSFDQDGQGYGAFARRFESGAFECPATPAQSGSCRRAGRSQLIIRDGARDSLDLLKLRWLDGDETTPASLGDPISTTPYSACLYVDESLVHQMAAPSATTCGRRLCWRQAEDFGYTYYDRHSDPEGETGGTRRLTLRHGADAETRVFVKARGIALAAETLLPVNPTHPVILQVRSISGECWGASFDPVSFRSNTLDRFRAKN